VEQKNGAVVREYIGYDRLSGFEEQALLSTMYTHLVSLFNFFIPEAVPKPRASSAQSISFGTGSPTQKLKSKTRVGSKEIIVYTLRLLIYRHI
jgi:hypothetical protein